MKFGFDSIFTVDCVGRSGGLALPWNNNFVVHIINCSRWHIHAKVWSKNRRERWFFIGFYGHPEVARHKESWNLLQHIRASPLVAWVCVGDFNEVLEDSKKWGG